MLVASKGSASLNPAGGLLIGEPGAGAFGRRRVDAQGLFMDYDGQPQASPDVTTRGIMILDSQGCVVARYYLDVFPNLDTPSALGAVKRVAPRLPAHACLALERGGVPELQPGAAAAAGIAPRQPSSGRAPQDSGGRHRRGAGRPHRRVSRRPRRSRGFTG